MEAWPLARNAKGAPLSNLENINVVLDNAEGLTLPWYDSFLDRLLTETGEWGDADDTRLAIALQADYGLRNVTPGMAHAVAVMRAQALPRHCVREWLDTLTWDGEPRLELALTDYWGAEPSPAQPEDYIRAASRNFLIGLVARVLRPGCKLDTMPVLEGPQGARKSSSLAALVGPDWHATAHESAASKDFFASLAGKWIVEIAELDSFSRAEVTRVKSIMSTAVDRYRPAYGRTARDYPRQCVFVGTTNKDDWGRDDTGLRRFWPVQCGRIDLDLIAAMRPQLFAEARDAFRAGAGWWEMPESTTAVQHERQEESSLADAVLPFLVGKDEVRLYDILTGPLKLDPGRITRQHELQVGRILKLNDWTKRNLTRGNAQGKWWTSPDWVGEPYR